MSTPPSWPLTVRAGSSSRVTALTGLAALLCALVITGTPASAASAQDTEGLAAKRSAFVAGHRVATGAALPDAPSQARVAQADALAGEAGSARDGCANDFNTDPKDGNGLDTLSTLLQHCADSRPYFFLDVQMYEEWPESFLDAVFITLDTDANGATGCVGDEFFVIGYVDPDFGLVADVVKTPDCDDSTWSYRGEAAIDHRSSADSVKMRWDAAQVESPRSVRYITEVDTTQGLVDRAPDVGGHILRTDGTPQPAKDYPTPTPRDTTDTCDRVVGNPFVDTVGTTHAYSVNCVSGYGITNGKSPVTYEPNGTLTQGQTATFLVNTLKVDGTQLNAFPFCIDDGVHVENMERLIGAAIIPRPPDGRCGPDVTISRERMAQWTRNTLQYAGVPGNPGTDWYSDDDASPLTRQINEVTSLGIATGKGDALFGPGESLTRGQMATFLARALDAMRNTF